MHARTAGFIQYVYETFPSFEKRQETTLAEIYIYVLGRSQAI